MKIKKNTSTKHVLYDFKKLHSVFLAIFFLFTFISAATILPIVHSPINQNNEGLYRSTIIQNSDDGTEINGTDWNEDGFEIGIFIPWVDCLGRYLDDTYDVGIRFYVENLTEGQEITYARLRFPAWGSDISSRVKLLIEGVLQESPTTFSENERPSQKLPKTNAKIDWEIVVPWLEGGAGIPLYYSSPDITSIINEILSLPDWGTGTEGKTLIITITENGSGSNPYDINRVFFQDSKDYFVEANLNSTVVLEVYPTVYDTFLGKELLGRITDSSATVNLYSIIETNVYIEYGTTSGTYTYTTMEYLNQPAEQGIDIILNDLTLDTQYFYRLAYQRAGEDIYNFGEEHTFHTQRPRGSSFSFAITADAHFPRKLPPAEEKMALYAQTLQNIAERDPDFMISLGDLVCIDKSGARWIETYDEAKHRYLQAREIQNSISHSIPFYLTIGNHEGEKGWEYDFDNPGQNNNSLSVIATKARKELVPNPYPNDFYTGDTTPVPEYGLREDYYSWEWGDALFVVLDPFWYTKNRPMDPSVHDNWEWTIGEEQYNWLYETLHSSTAKWKFVFIHHLTSSNCSGGGSYWYGRGGIEIAKYKVDNAPSFEWGGENETGEYIFDVKRPNWTHGAIHDMLIGENVSIVFHGHDHLFAKQHLDGVVYQECPMPSNVDYNYGFIGQGGYKYGVILPNSGHIEVIVNTDFVRVDYIRSFLPGDGENGLIEYSYYLGLSGDLNNDGVVDLSDLAILLASYEVDDGGDIDGDGDTDHNDLILLLQNYGMDIRS